MLCPDFPIPFSESKDGHCERHHRGGDPGIGLVGEHVLGNRAAQSSQTDPVPHWGSGQEDSWRLNSGPCFAN